MKNEWEDTVAFVTGANRGLGLALTNELIARGARRVYAASRDKTKMMTTASDPRIVPIQLDITNAEHVRAAAAAAGDTTLLLNNAGVLASMSVLTSEPSKLRQDLDVNYYGVLDLVRAFLPALEKKATKGAAIVNVLSVASLANMPALGGYSVSKAAAWSLTQALRGELRPRGIRVHAVFPGPIDTDMIRGFDMAKASAESVAKAILDGVSEGKDDIAPDAMSSSVLETFTRDPRAIERQFSS